LAKRFIAWRKPSEELNDLDISIRGLEPLEVTPFGPESFLTLRDTAPVSWGHRGNDMLILGHPKNKVRAVRDEPLVEHAIFAYSGPRVDDDVIQGLGYEPELHLGVMFPRKDAVRGGVRTTAPSPDGLSGSPLFGFNTLRTDDRPDVLVGIATIWRKRNPECIIGTDIAVALSLIRKTFPECDDAFEQEAQSSAGSG
jgi:hypothetical protein